MGVSHGGEASRTSCERGVGGDAPDANEVHRRQRRTGIESIPSEPEDQSSGSGDGQIVRKHRCAAIAFEFASESRPKHVGAGERDETANRVHHGGSGEVMEALAKIR